MTVIIKTSIIDKYRLILPIDLNFFLIKIEPTKKSRRAGMAGLRLTEKMFWITAFVKFPNTVMYKNRTPDRAAKSGTATQFFNFLLRILSVIPGSWWLPIRLSVIKRMYNRYKMFIMLQAMIKTTNEDIVCLEYAQGMAYMPTPIAVPTSVAIAYMSRLVDPFILMFFF
jgi:hypothetical protein